MPRKYVNGEIVKVYYTTRSQHFEFMGKVTDYADKKYDVLYLGELKDARTRTHSFKTDMVFKCWVYELSPLPELYIRESMPTIAQQSFASFCKDYISGNRWYSQSTRTEKCIWYSFKTKRLLDEDFSRVFPVVTMKDRGDYVYDY